MAAHIRKHVVDKRNWLDGNTFDSGLALCQVIPGAIIMQLVSYIGLKLKGKKGAIVCFVGFGFPAFLIMFILSVIYKHSKNLETVETILKGLRIIIIAIIANAAFEFGKKNFKNVNDWIIAAIAAALFLTKLHPALVLLAAAILGLVMTNKQSTVSKELVRVRTFNFFLILIALVIVGAIVLFLVSKEYFTLGTILLRIDLFSFGGGLASMPIMYHEFVDLFGWFDEKTFMDGVVLGQVTPGSIIIAATFFGYMHFGVLGSIFATIAVFTPSFLILMGLIPFFDRLKTYPQFNRVVNGILCSFVGLLTIVTYRFAIGVHWNVYYIVFAVVALALLIRKVDVIWIILGGVLLSFFLP